MEYRCLEKDKQLIFNINAGNMRDEDIDYFLTDSSFLKDLSLFLYKETQKKEVKYCSDTLMIFLFKYLENFLDLPPLCLPLFGNPDPSVLGSPLIENPNNIAYFNKINDVIVILRFELASFNVVDLTKKYLINNSNFLQAWQDDRDDIVILNMDPIFSDPENSVSLYRDSVVLHYLYISWNMMNYCDKAIPITEEALEKLLNYKKENNEEEYVLLKMMVESMK